MSNYASMRVLDVSWRFVGGVVAWLVFACVLFALLVPAPLKTHFQNASYSEYRPGGARCDPARLSALKQGQAQIERDRCGEAAEEYHFKSEDLSQQTRAADSAEDMASLTYQQTKMMAAGTVFGFLTLVAAFFAVLYARKAGGEAQRAANAAEGQLVEDRKVTTAELRPYVFVDVVTADDEGGYLLVNTVLRNYGTIPARSMTVKRDCYFASDPGEALRKKVLSDVGIHFPVCVHGHDRTAPTILPFGPGQREAWNEGKLIIIIRIRIRYRGIRRYAERFDYFHTRQSLSRGRPYIISESLHRQRAAAADLLALIYQQEQEDTAEHS